MYYRPLFFVQNFPQPFTNDNKSDKMKKRKSQKLYTSYPILFIHQRQVRILKLLTYVPCNIVDY